MAVVLRRYKKQGEKNALTETATKATKQPVYKDADSGGSDSQGTHGGHTAWPAREGLQPPVLVPKAIAKKPQ